MTKPVVNSYDEWTQLHEVIVGNVEGFQGFHLENSFNLYFWENIKSFLASKKFFRNKRGEFCCPTIKIEAYIIDELKEDLQGFVEALESLGIRVRRPASVVGKESVQTPFWQSNQSPPLNIRDQSIILGTSIVETSPHVRARIFENDYLKPLFNEYMQGGACWICMPRPSLCSGILDKSYFSLSSEEQAALQDHNTLALEGLNYEIVFDGAQCIRIGKDVLVNVANRNHELGFQWLKANFGITFKFHRLYRMSDTHLDSIILPLRAGLWLIRDRKYLDFLPKKFSKWDYIVAPEVEKDLFPSYKNHNLSIASKFIDMNVFSINDSTVVVNSLFPELIKKLESRGFNIVPVRHRHRRLFGGGFHCFTLDICRSGDLESYCD